MAETDPYDLSKVDSPLELVVKSVESAERKYHNAFVERVERRYDAYRGLASDDTGGNGGRDVKDWHAEFTTPYILQTVEGMLATMLEPRPRCDVKPRPHPEEPLDEVIERMNRARSLEDVITYAFDRDHFAEKQRDFMQQDLIAGVTVLKDYWMSERREVTRLAESTAEIYDGLGQVVDTLSYMDSETVEALVKDDACSEVRDVRDFFWPAQAPRVDKAEWLVDRTWETYASCKRQGERGYYRNIEKLKETRAQRPDSGSTRREMRLRNIDRTEGLVEVLEYWTPERVITVGNRTVVLRDRPNPFWNGRIPFIVCSAMPDAFQIPGVSVVEALAQLQEMLWTLQNQRLDVVRMLANLITLVRSDVDDPDAFQWAPNARWQVEDPSQVSQLQIDPTVANITLQAEALVKGDLQNIMGGLPMAGGVDSQTIDQETATGVSIITSIAQRIIQARKQHYLWAYAKLGKDFLLLWQQFVRDDRVVKVVGAEGAASYKTVSPRDLQGDFDVTIDVTSDSLLRQERRAESQALMQLSASIQPIMAQSGVPLNLRAPYEKVLDTFDVPDKERWFLSQPGAGLQQLAPGAPQPQGGGVPPQGQGMPGLAPLPSGNGMTNQDAAAGPLSPSPSGGGPSMSPESAMATLMRQRGTPPSG